MARKRMCLTHRETNTKHQNYHMDKSKIQDIIMKCLLEEASSDEHLLLEAWRKESDQNEALYQEYSSIWNATAEYTPSIDFHSKTESAYQKHLDLLANEEGRVVWMKPNTASIQKSSSSTRIRTLYLRRVASLAAILVVVFGAVTFFKTMGTTSILAEGDVLFAALEDGSSIWLDEGSTVTFNKGFGVDHREISLEGKAFFDVVRNESVPFNINTNDLQVSVLGTSFTVDARQDKNTVAVRTGLVKVESAEKEVTLSADQKVKLENDNFTEMTASDEDVKWRNEILTFDNAPLDQVVSDINIFHNDRIILTNDVKNIDCPFTARSLENTRFEDIIEVLKVTYDLEAEERADGIVALTISDCK